MSPIALCILFALASTTLANLGLGVQKAGVPWMDGGLAGLREGANRRYFAIWVGGILMSIAFIPTQGLALHYGPASVVGALGAFGLIPLYLFAGLVLKEKVTTPHWLALIFIGAGVAYIGYRSSHTAAATETLHMHGLLTGAAVAIAIPLVGLALATWKLPGLAGIAIGLLAGTPAGLALIIMKVGTILDNAWVGVGAAYIGALTVNFLLIQWAYRRATAVQVVPSNNSAAILVPVMLAPVAFAEPITSWLVTGTLSILLGVACLAWGEYTLARHSSGHGDRSDLVTHDELGSGA